MPCSSQYFSIPHFPEQNYHFHSRLSLDLLPSIPTSTVVLIATTPGAIFFLSASNKKLPPLDNQMPRLAKLALEAVLSHSDT